METLIKRRVLRRLIWVRTVCLCPKKTLGLYGLNQPFYRVPEQKLHIDVLLIVAPILCGGSVFGPCFVMQYLVSFLVLQSSSRERESWLPSFSCLPDVL